MAAEPFSEKTQDGRVRHPELFRALRGIWQVEGEEMVVEVDQETGELMACTYDGEPVDPCGVLTRGSQLRPFEKRFQEN